jgi:hypothetical protein
MRNPIIVPVTIGVSYARPLIKPTKTTMNPNAAYRVNSHTSPNILLEPDVALLKLFGEMITGE